MDPNNNGGQPSGDAPVVPVVDDSGAGAPPVMPPADNSGTAPVVTPEPVAETPVSDSGEGVVGSVEPTSDAGAGQENPGGDSGTGTPV